MNKIYGGQVYLGPEEKTYLIALLEEHPESKIRERLLNKLNGFYIDDESQKRWAKIHRKRKIENKKRWAEWFTT